MKKTKTNLFENGLIWFGAGVSLAEIMAGTAFAPLGFSKGIPAILIGHLIGCVLLFLAGVIGGKQRKSAMETVKMSFGQKGSLLFAALNVIQLVGWTAIMIYDGALAAGVIVGIDNRIWALVIGGLIAVWILIGIKSLEKINMFAMTGLFILTVILSFVIFGGGNMQTAAADSISFGAAVELSVAMPLSWLPLISDYTRDAEKPVKASGVSAAVYGIVSCWMYIIGMGAASFAGTSDIAGIMVSAGLGTAGLLIVILSTVTTTFLDAYSAGISGETLTKKVSGRYIALAAAALGTIGAVVYTMDNITEFLYFIGSVFAPMIAILISDFFILKNNSENSAVNLRNTVIWIIGFVLYRVLMRIDIIVGNTLPDILITMLLCIAADRIGNKKCEVE